LPSLLDKFSNEIGDAYSNKHISITLSDSLFGRQYLSNKWPKTSKIITTKKIGNFESDATDKIIIDTLLTVPFKSIRTFARDIGISQSTAQYRLKRLENANVITGWKYKIAEELLGVQGTRFLLSLSKTSRDIKDRIFGFCSTQPQIVKVSQTAGNWDLVLDVESSAHGELIALRSKIYEQFNDCLGQTRMLTVLKTEESKGSFFGELNNCLRVAA